MKSESDFKAPGQPTADSSEHPTGAPHRDPSEDLNAGPRVLEQSDTTLASRDWLPDAAFLKDILAQIRAIIGETAPDSETTGRLKTSHSVRSKERRFQTQVRAIHDKVGVRIIVRDLGQCFATIDRLHEEMVYLEQLYDDYITYPKENGYQSLHTTLVAANGWPFEVQVRTRNMHERSEQGAAAHEVYKAQVILATASKSANTDDGSLVPSLKLIPTQRESLPRVGRSETDCFGGKVAFVSTYPPITCTVASYTAELTQAIQLLCPKMDCIVIAISQTPGAQRYAEQIHYQIAANSISAYRDAAGFLNTNNVRVLSLQHEYEIFGGAHGAYVLSLLRDVRIPIVTTLHTISKNLTLVQQAIMNEVCALSAILVVSNAHSAKLLAEQHDVPAEKIATISLGELQLDEQTLDRKLKPLSPSNWQTVASGHLRSFRLAFA